MTFYPDGSSDSAEIVIRLRTDDDPRAAVITVDGFNGTVTADIRTLEELEDQYDGISTRGGP